jgi:hypothetical protein
MSGPGYRDRQVNITCHEILILCALAALREIIFIQGQALNG